MYTLRLHIPENCTTLADDLVELVNPSKAELYDTLQLLLSRGTVSCLVTSDDGHVRFYAHDLCLQFAAYLKGV